MAGRPDEVASWQQVSLCQEVSKNSDSYHEVSCYILFPIGKTGPYLPRHGEASSRPGAAKIRRFLRPQRMPGQVGTQAFNLLESVHAYLLSQHEATKACRREPHRRFP